MNRFLIIGIISRIEKGTMWKIMKTVKELLTKFNLKIELPGNILNMELDGEFTSFEQKKESFPTFEDSTSYKEYDCFEFRGEYSLCKIIPDNENNIIGIFDIVGDIIPKARGKFFDAEGNVVSIT